MKMNQTWKKHGIDIRPGMRIKGKWHKKTYLIKKTLGQGAVGTVYLCEYQGKQAALKISDKSSSMTTEVNVLKSLQKVQGNRLGPYLLDVDDWEAPNGMKFTFYVMEYLQGETISTFIKANGGEWVGVFMLQILEDLEKLHRSGWVFGDFKTENLLVVSSPTRIRWIDVGGTTQVGRAIKEYTEFYDRGYWTMGSRKAEPSYDLFALVMVILTIYYPRRFEKGPKPEVTLLNKLNEVKQLKIYRDCLKKAIYGKYQSSAEMKQEVAATLYRVQRTRQQRKGTDAKETSKRPLLIETGSIFFIALFYYVFSLFLP
ncbi:protein kinase family protein [Virgibacillus byunsanensis]|uniref:Protein kinase family protein n=1 Tax=Virgibacillus byunsanensis TaxID=570945 RepID=A0ABW3LPZ6_9BACI